MDYSEERAEVLLGENSDGLQCTEKVTKCKDAVCYLYSCDDENVRRGTGFFTRIIIKGKEHKCIATNNHVIPCAEVARDGTARFFFEGDNQGIEIKLKPELFFTTHKELDYTLVGCDAAVIENNYGITPLDFQNNTGDVDEDIFIFQHPKGEPKKVSYQKISNIEPPYLFYKADTDVGSSGSPVLLKFKLIGIHSKGSDTLKYNKGTLCQEILQHLNNGTYTQPKPIQEMSSLKGRKRASLINGSMESSPMKKPKSTSQSYGQHGQSYIAPLPTEAGLHALAKDIVSNWKSIGRKLQIPNTELMKIHKDNINYDDITEKAFAMLLAWKERKGESATMIELGIALEDTGLVCTAQKHC